jgi:hypothetical protein
MKKQPFLILFVLSILLFGCPYQSDVELCTYEEALKTDKNLEGSWVAFHADGSKDELLIEKIAKSVLQVSHKELDKNDRSKGTNKYRAYAINLNGTVLFNIETKENKYLLAKYGWTGKNEFYLQTISQEYMEKNFVVDSVTTDNLKSFLFDKANREEIYDDAVEFYRKDSPEYLKVKMFMKKSGF